MATHSGILSWRIPGTEESDGMLSTGLHRVRQLKRLSSSMFEVNAIRIFQNLVDFDIPEGVAYRKCSLV